MRPYRKRLQPAYEPGNGLERPCAERPRESRTVEQVRMIHGEVVRGNFKEGALHQSFGVSLKRKTM